MQVNFRLLENFFAVYCLLKQLINKFLFVTHKQLNLKKFKCKFYISSTYKPNVDLFLKNVKLVHVKWEKLATLNLSWNLYIKSKLVKRLRNFVL